MASWEGFELQSLVGMLRRAYTIDEIRDLAMRDLSLLIRATSVASDVDTYPSLRLIILDLCRLFIDAVCHA